MFELTTKGADGLKTIIGLCFSLNEEAVIEITNNGLDFKVMDIDRSGLIDFTWESKNMVNFKCENEHKIGIRTDDFNKILKRASKQDITLKHDGQGNLKIGIGDSKSYTNRLVETETIQSGSSPKVSYKTTVTIPYTILKEKVDDMLIVGHFMNITVTNGEIKFNVTGDGQKGSTSYKDESIKVDEDISGNFSLSHLDNALKCVSKVENIELSVDNKFPLCMGMTLPDMGTIKYYLAPYTGGSQ